MQSRYSELYGLGDDLSENIANPTLGLATSRHAEFDQRLVTLRLVLEQCACSLKDECSDNKHFCVVLESVDRFLDAASSKLAQADPDVSVAQADLEIRHDELKSLLSQFHVCFVCY